MDDMDSWNMQGNFGGHYTRISRIYFTELTAAFFKVAGFTFLAGIRFGGL
jgi:hypothetical protein